MSRSHILAILAPSLLGLVLLVLDLLGIPVVSISVTASILLLAMFIVLWVIGRMIAQGINREIASLFRDFK